ALSLLEEARTIQQVIVRKDQANPNYLSDSLWCRQQLVLSRVEAGRTVAAGGVKEQLEVLAAREGLVRRQPKHDGVRFEAAAAVGSARQALGLAGQLARGEPAYLYDLACAGALCASLAAEGKEQAGQLAAALDALRRAVAAGYDNAHRLRTDSQLAPLRSEAAFQQLLRDLEGKGKPAGQR